MFYLYDGLGSTRALSNATGTITDTYDYSAYGVEIDSTGTTENNYKYTGEQFDANLNQIYLRARYYDPSIGRFTSQDTWMGNNSDPVTLHKYLYANIDPVNNIDPTGNFSLGGLMSAINIASTLVTTAQTTYSLFQIASGDENAPTAKQIGFEILAGMGAGKLIKIFSKRFRACRVGNSFAEGTLVSTSNGLVPIENIKIGDVVHSFDEHTQKVVEQEVVHLIHGDKEHEMITLNVSSGDSIRTTDGHPFYVAENDDKWVPAKDLMLGDSLLGSDGSLISIVDIKSELIKEKVYNLSVANSHTYYVGDQKLLAHNSTCRIPHRARPRIEQGNDRQGWIHIQRRHFPGGDVSSRQGDLFASGTSQFQIEQAARILVTKGRRTSDVNLPIQTFEKNMVINGRQARYKVVVDSDDANRVITIFPMSR